MTQFVFTASTKTKLLNDFLALIETGRFHHYTTEDADRARLIEQLRQCEYTTSANAIQWAVPDHATWFNPFTQRIERLHDDHLLAIALVAVLKDVQLPDYFPALVQPAAPEPDYRRGKF